MQIADREIAVISLTPPPYGGVSIHTQRLISCLKLEGISVIIHRWAPQGIMTRRFTSALSRIIRLLYFVISAQPRVFHFHVISGWPLFIALPILRLRKRRVVWTIHSPRPIKEYTTIGKKFKPVFELFLRWIDFFICVNPIYVEWVTSFGIGAERVVLLPAYIPPCPQELDDSTIPSFLMEFFKIHSPIIGAQGWLGDYFTGRDTYGIDLLLEIIPVLRKIYPRIGLFFLVSGVKDVAGQQDAHSIIEKLAISENVILADGTFPLCAIFKFTDLFLRPTRSDGDSVSVREALGLGIPVVASNCISRPDGCVIHASEDVEDLCEKILSVLQTKYMKGPQGDTQTRLPSLSEPIFDLAPFLVAYDMKPLSTDSGSS